MAGFTKKSKALSSLLEGETIKRSAELSGVSERTVYRWLADPSFRADLREEQSRRVESAGRKVLELSERAIEALRDVLSNPGGQGANVKRLAAVSVLELVIKYNVAVTLAERIAELESRVFGEAEL